MFKFEVLQNDKKTKARVGKLTTPHGIVHTPNFIPVGTQGSVKSLDPRDLKEIGIEIMFSNTYHLHLRPGEDIVKDFGGIAKYMNWNAPAMTDSGGFQVFSLGQKKFVRFDADKTLDIDSNQKEKETRLVKITDDGVRFRSHLDGSEHMFTPEVSIDIQKKLGADIILAFDECAPHPSTHEYTKEAMERTHEWGLRCLKEFQKNDLPARLDAAKLAGKTEIASLPRQGGAPRNDKDSSRLAPFARTISNKQALYGIIQGGVYKDLREVSAKFISSQDFDGIAIGGVAVGESKSEMRDVLDWVGPFLPENKPRHLLGIGEIDDMFAAVENGMDTFDCVVPSRMGRMGWVFLFPPEGNMKNRFRFDVSKSSYLTSKEPLSKDCECYVCKNFTRGYICHLFRAHELLSYRLITYHNLSVFSELMKQIRESVQTQTFQSLKNKWLS